MKGLRGETKEWRGSALGGRRPRRSLGTAGLAVAVLSVVAIATVGLVGFHRVVLEGAGNPALSDAQASADLNQYFSKVDLHPKAAVRKSGAEARDELDLFAQSLDSEESLGRRFCERHPDRCGKAAKAAAKAAALADALTIQRNEAAAQAKRNQATAKAKPQGLLKSYQSSSPPVAKLSQSSSPAVASHARDKQLGDDVMDVAPTKAADDGDVHVDGAAVQKYMFDKDGKAAQEWLKSDKSALRSDPHATNSLKLKPASKLSSASRLGNKLSQADDAELAKCNVPPPRPAYCHLLLDLGVDLESVKTMMPDREETEYRYASNNGGHTRPLHALVPIDMKHGDGGDVGMNYVNYGVPDRLVPAEEQHEEGNLVPSENGREKGGPISPVLREGATRTQNPQWAEEGTHYPYFHYKIKSLDRATSDQVLYGAIDDYKTLGLALADDFVSPTKDAEEREKEHGVEPQVFTERFKPLSKYASVKQWREEVNPAGQWALDDVDALDQAEGEASNSFGGRSAVEQRLIYGSDPFSLGHPVDGETDNVEGLGDVRLKISRHIRGPIRPMFSTTSMGPRRAALQTLGAHLTRSRRHMHVTFYGVGLWLAKRQRFPMVVGTNYATRSFRRGRNIGLAATRARSCQPCPLPRGLCNIVFLCLSTNTNMYKRYCHQVCHPRGDKLMCFFLLPRKAVADRKRGCGVEQRISTAEAVADRKRGCGVEQRFCYAAFDTDTIIAQHIYRAFGRLRHVT